MFRALLLLAAFTLAFAPADASARVDKKRIATIEKHRSQLDQTLISLELMAKRPQRDVRDRTEFDDFAQWAYNDDVRSRVKTLLESARAKDASDPDTSLAEAETLLDGASARASEISKYWDQRDAVFWRDRWKAFAETNGLPPDVTDPEIVSREQVVLGHLSKGEFAAATAASSEVETRLKAAIRAATSELMKKKSDADMQYLARSTPCPGTDGPRANASLTQAASPVQYYPPASRRRDEQGDVVVRARVAATGCATAFAVMVGSGYPELDTAAIRVAEASRYAAAMDASGQPVDASVTFKVKFTIKP